MIKIFGVSELWKSLNLPRTNHVNVLICEMKTFFVSMAVSMGKWRPAIKGVSNITGGVSIALPLRKCRE